MARKVIFLKVGDVSPWIVPDDWNNDDNKVHCIAAGCGGWIFPFGGAAYSMVSNLVLGVGTSIEFEVGVGGEGTADFFGLPEAGGDTWFNGTAIDAASVSAQGGKPEEHAPGGSADNGIGDVKYSGGRGLAHRSGGGGGAAGPDGDGGVSDPSGAEILAGEPYLTGGSANGLAGPAGASGGENGTAGAYWTSTETGETAGPGSGGAGATAADSSSGDGGEFGGSAGAVEEGSSSHPGRGADGLIVIEYEPLPQATVVANIPDSNIKAIG